MLRTNPAQFIGQSITITGLSENAHQGALVTLSDGSEVYVRGLRRWDHSLLGKQLKVTGRLGLNKLAPDPEVDEGGLASHGMVGSSMVLEEATWEELT